ncbi:MAG: hypothetical protein CMN75_15810 [Spirochaeta sp.]|nr:hypothetical protein [Spirochaeta sp.]RPG03217.1 MAG: cation:proton antiporter [Proteobacteria bacterium TMED72]
MSALGISFLVATLLIFLFRRIGQPTIVACIVGGFLLQFFRPSIPPFHMDTLLDLQTLGIVLLLVVAGMQVDVDQALRNWRMLLLAGMQVGVGLLLGALLTIGASSLGWMSVQGNAGIAVSALCLTLSSTALVVEGLRSRGAADTPFGQAILLLMLFQDVVAVIGLSLIGLPGNEGFSAAAGSPSFLFLQFVGATVVAVLIGRTVMVKIIEKIRYDEGLLLIFVLGWAAGLGGIAVESGFSPSVAGFLAGVALSFTPHKSAIEVRIEPLKVFGVTIYFIFLGSTLPVGHLGWHQLWPIVLATVLIVAVRPWTTAWLARATGMAPRDASRFGLTIGQGSEFSMVLAASAYHAKIFDESAFLVIVMASVLSMVLSSWVEIVFRRRGREGRIEEVDGVDAMEADPAA